MADATVAALSVILGGDASALDKMLSGAQSSVNSFAKNVSSIVGGIGLANAIEGAFSAVTGAIKQGLADADALSKMSESTGVSVDELSKLKYAGDLAGVSSQALGSSLNSLAKSMVDVANGGVTPAANAFNAIGVSVKNADGTMKSQSMVLSDIADKFAGYRDGAAKAALAQALFGDGGAALIPMLNKGSAGLSDLGDEAQKFGLVLSEDAQVQVEALNDDLKKMDAIKQGLALTITSKLLPSFEQMSAAMLDAKQNSTLMSTAADGIATVLKTIISVGLQGFTIIQRLTAELGAFFGVLSNAKLTDGFVDTFTKAFAALDVEGAKTAESFKALKTAQDAMWADPSQSWDQQASAIRTMGTEVQNYGKTWTQTTAPILQATDATRNALQMFLDSTAKRSAATEAEAQTVGMATDAQAALKVQYEAQAIATAKNIPLTEAYRQAIQQAANTAASSAQSLAGAQLTQASLAPWDARNQKLAEYNQLLSAGKISSETFSAASAKLQFPAFTQAALQAQDYTAQLDTLGTSGINGIASAFAQAATGQQAWGAAFSQAALNFITQLTEMIAKAILFKAIMTAIGFSGGGPVGSIVTGGPDGPGTFFADGGFVAGPGTGTSDSIPAMLSNGEFVVTAAQTRKFAPLLAAINADRLPMFAAGGPVTARVGVTSVPSVAAPSLGQASQTINVAGLGKNSYSRSDVISILDGLNSLLGNGYNLKVKPA